MLCRLLILVQRLLWQFDGEEGLRAGVQVEGFAGPAGSDGTGVGVLEAVHARELFGLGLLLLPAEREVQMPGQMLVADPRLAALPIGFGKQPTLTISGDSHPALMNHGVMPLAQQDQIV